MVRVIKADEMGTLKAAKTAVLDLRDLAAEAREIVLEARKDSAAILAQARADANRIRQDAAETGMAEGFAKGLATGLVEGAAQAHAEAQADLQAQTAELAAVAREIVSELAAVRDQTLHHMRREMLDFSLELVGKIVGQVAMSDIAAARNNLAKVLDLASQSGEITIKVNTRQLRRLQEHCVELTETLSVQGPVRLVGDETIGVGGVKLISRSGEIDATIETQLANLAKGLAGGVGGLFEQTPSPDEAQAGGTYVSDAGPLPASAGEDAYEA